MSEVKALAGTEISCKKSKCAELDGRQLGAKKQSFVELNLDCLLEIFEYLPVLDRIRVARVNKTWYETSRLSLSRLKSWQIEYVGSIIKFKESKKNLIVKVDCTSKAFEKLLRRFGDHVLDFFAMDVQDLYQVMVILYSCANLKEVYLGRLCISIAKFLAWRLEKLTNLSLDNMDGIYRDSCLETILSKLNLKYFHLCAVDTNISGEFLKSLSPDIETLKIEDCELTNLSSAFNILANFKNLTSLSLSCALSDDMDVDIFIDLVKKQNLKKLNISWNYLVVDDDFLIKFAKYADGLIELDISGNNVTDRGLNAVTNLPNLEILIIENLDKIRGEVDVNLPNLKHLPCRDSPNVSANALIKFLKTSDKIELLDPENISEEFILSAVKITQTRKSKIPLKILIDTNDEKILKIVNNISEEHACLLKFSTFLIDDRPY